MKRILLLLTTAFLFSCTNTGNNESKEMKFAAVLPSGQDYYFNANGDTFFYKSIKKTISYDSSWFEFHPKKQDTVVVPPGNTLPTANAGPDITITLPTNKVILVGDGGDEDGAFTVQWTKVSGSGTVTVSNVLVNAAVENLTAGTTVMRLTITGDKGEKVSDDMTITVKPVTPPPPPPPVTPIPLSFTQIPYSDADLNRPAAGAEQWHNFNVVNIPTEGTNTQRLDVYYRSPLTWAKIETAKDVYNWTPVINMLNGAIDKKQKVTLGFMSVYHDPEDGVISYDGGRSAYPLYLHQLMQSESVKDWRAGSGWVPNYNSPNYIGRLRAFNTALNTLLETGIYKGIKYRDVINSIDVRGYGNYGEWHNGGIVDQVSQIPAGAHATTATLKAIIDAHTQTLPNFQLSIIMTAFDANWLQHTRTSAEVAYYALTTSNAYGKLGWRRDNWGATDNYIRDLLENNTRTYNGVALNSLIMNVWKYAPVTGEPMNNAPNDYGDFERQVRLYHAASFGNGNIFNTITTALKNNVRAASKAAGYRLAPTAGSITPGTGSFAVSLTWANTGIAPTYENWDVVFDLIDATGTVKYSFVSKFKPRLFLPGSITVADSFTVPASGTYKVNMRVTESYRGNMPLFITGKNADGSVTLKTITL